MLLTFLSGESVSEEINRMGLTEYEFTLCHSLVTKNIKKMEVNIKVVDLTLKRIDSLRDKIEFIKTPTFRLIPKRSSSLKVFEIQNNSHSLPVNPSKDDESIQMAMQQCKQIITQQPDNLVIIPVPTLQEKSLLE